MTELPIKRLTQPLMDSIAEQARSSPRQRKNHNFHEHHDRVQRFLNVLQPGTYVRPHRHVRPADADGFEFFLVLQGAIGILILNQSGSVIHTEKISATGTTRGVELGEGMFHTLIALEPDTVMFELKEGPYVPMDDKDFLPQFPLENTPDAKQWIQTWQGYFA
ncbi:WbuC family cupin fold metalloprotein [Leptolyngbya sp. FACHB-17]|uniref:WbuC family cupin fold metalloprotein n=1 Tax=unclassified Leptolyngbya TaxID=2650499 RepID=UPI0016815726|nr:WbuC family cupin fold metalloprotein [Leptolyngbya sp. FACHB-17]MBD2081217.1 WbuC family cupin fold metalloprotein [Leptolyngbya sp. FACHB-17]